jgi:hypothetical protein
MADKENSKTARRSSVRSGNGGFEADPTCPRFIPMSNGTIIYRDPSNGLNRRLTKNEALELGYEVEA